MGRAGRRAAALVPWLLLGAVVRAEDPIARGRYLTHDVAMCVQCHTPRRADGSLDTDREFMGGDFPVSPPPFRTQTDWCTIVPRIAGLPGWEHDAAVEFLMSGAEHGRNGVPIKRPMPPFRLNRPDAEAVVSYLESLEPSGR